MEERVQNSHGRRQASARMTDRGDAIPRIRSPGTLAAPHQSAVRSLLSLRRVLLHPLLNPFSLIRNKKHPAKVQPCWLGAARPLNAVLCRLRDTERARPTLFAGTQHKERRGTCECPASRDTTPWCSSGLAQTEPIRSLRSGPISEHEPAWDRGCPGRHRQSDSNPSRTTGWLLRDRR